ncbi:MAG: hypothetical protein WAZ77_15315, partial [Candidatus Nitrosopolaris sp.]
SGVAMLQNIPGNSVSISNVHQKSSSLKQHEVPPKRFDPENDIEFRHGKCVCKDSLRVILSARECLSDEVHRHLLDKKFSFGPDD